MVLGHFVVQKFFEFFFRHCVVLNYCQRLIRFAKGGYFLFVYSTFAKSCLAIYSLNFFRLSKFCKIAVVRSCF